MNDDRKEAFKTDLAKKAYESTFEIERELRTVQKRLSPFAPECESLRQRKSYEDVIFLDFNFAHEQDVENSLWKKVHHRTIEAYRSNINKFNAANGKTKPVEYRKLLHHFATFIKDASKYYRCHIQRLIVHFEVSELHHVIQTFKLDIPTGTTTSTYSKELKDLVVKSCHANLIYLGDLSRYRELHAGTKNGEKNWGPALGYYQFARKLIPDAGAPMNQLAVVAIYSNNVLSSTYFFLRAVCAVKEFPTAHDNLVLGFKKILSKEATDRQSTIDLYLYIVSSIYLQDVSPDLANKKKRVLQQLRQLITERQISAEMLSQVMCINLGLLFLLSKAHDKSTTPHSNSIRMQHMLEFNQDVIGLLLAVLKQRMSAIATIPKDLSTNLDPIIRRILPALRLSSKWIRLNLNLSRPLWADYVSAITLCGSKFPRAALPTLSSPLAEDLDLLGFKPLDGGLNNNRFAVADNSIAASEENLSRLSALLSDAAEIAVGIDQELATSSSSQAPSRTNVSQVNSKTTKRSHQNKVSSILEGQLGGMHGLPQRSETSTYREGPPSHASEPSMAFSLNQMVDSLVGQTGDEEEIVFRGRKQNTTIDISHNTSAVSLDVDSTSRGNWNPTIPANGQPKLWSSLRQHSSTSLG